MNGVATYVPPAYQKYSSTDRAVGTDINGQIIYEKTVVKNVTVSSGSAVIDDITNKFVIDVKTILGWGTSSDSGIFVLPYCGSNGTWISCVPRNNELKIQCSSSITWISNQRVICVYRWVAK